MTNEKVANSEISTMSTDDILQLASPLYQEVENNGDKIKVRIVEITPQLAEILMSRNTNNRPINNSNVNYLIKEIKSGNWKLNGESIKIDKDGNMIDGQHRLTAIIKTGVSLSLFIMSGFKSEIFTVLDTGRKRQGSDALSTHGVLNASTMASTIKHIIQFENLSYSETGAAGRTISNQGMIEYYDANSESLTKSVAFGKKHYVNCNKILTPSLIAVFHYLFEKKSEVECEIFLTTLCSGLGLEAQSPINVLRNKLIANLGDKKNTLKQSVVVKYVIVAWNKFRKGESCKQLRFSEDEDIVIE